MTLKEKLKSFSMDNHIEKYAEHNAKQLEKIADEFAFEFGKWLNNKVINPNGKHHNLAGNAKVDQLLVIFKKEKGL